MSEQEWRETVEAMIYVLKTATRSERMLAVSVAILILRSAKGEIRPDLETALHHCAQ